MGLTLTHKVWGAGTEPLVIGRVQFSWTEN